jgi:hypothetical protein
MTSYRNYSTIDIEEKAAAKEKNTRGLLDIDRLILSGLSRLNEYFYPLAAKYKKNEQ